MNAIVPVNMGQVSTKFHTEEMDASLSAGIHTGYGVMSYKGKVWAIKKGGETTPLMRDDGDGARGSIEAVIIKAAPNLSKIYYASGFVEGSTEAPDCFSTNGMTPDPSAKSRQANACANCPKNQWGSKISEAGKQMKACADSKRLAIAPLQDIDNEAFGGPMLLRVPAGSLQELVAYEQKMKGLGYPYYAIGTRIAFDPTAAHPKLVLGAIRALSDEEADKILELRKSHAVARILAEGTEMVASEAPAQQQVVAAFEQPPLNKPVAAPKDVAPKETAPKAAPKAAAPKPAPTPEPVAAAEGETISETAPTGTSFDAELDAELDNILPK